MDTWDIECNRLSKAFEQHCYIDTLMCTDILYTYVHHIDHGGQCIDSSFRQFVKDHGILKLGDVKSLPVGNLKCYFLFHAVTLPG